VEHTPWVGQGYEAGINGQRICIVGHSHHHKIEESDSDDFTTDVVGRFLSGKLGRDSFFPPMAGYFGFSDKEMFWQSVVFFNLLPNCIGESDDDKYGTGTPEQIARGKERFLRIIRQTKPDLVFVFTTKGWCECPPTIEEAAGKGKAPLGAEFPGFSWGTYTAGEHTVMAFGLRHPERARSELMRSGVRHILEKWRTLRRAPV